MSSLLTWSGIYSGNEVAAGYDKNSSFEALLTTLSAAQLGSDYPWEICSSDLTGASYWYITLKRKSGTPGRILFINGLVYENINTEAATSAGQVISGVFSVGYFPGATSDTPVNLTNSSDPVFTGQITNSIAPFSATFNYLIPGAYFSTVANEDMVFVFADSASYKCQAGIMAGMIFVDQDDVAHPGSYINNGPSHTPPASNGSVGYFMKHPVSGEVEHWGDGAGFLAAIFEYQGRDDVSKKIFFPRIHLASIVTADKKNFARWQLRQISNLVKPLTYGEIASSSSSEIYAFCLTEPTHAYRWWCCNFKLNV